MAGVEFSFYVLFIAFFLSGKINNLQFHSCTRSLSYSRALLHYLQFYLEWKKKLYQANNHIAYLDDSDDLVITTDFCTWFTSDFYTTDDLVITNIDFYVGM